MEENKQSSWDSTETLQDFEPQDKASRKRSAYSSIITGILAAAIIIIGFVAPSFFNSVSNSEHDRIISLADPNSEVSLHVFDEPVSLYPWNLYSTESVSSLSYAQRGFLFEHNVPNFLITSLSAYGMDINLVASNTEQSSYDYVSDLLASSFVFLHTGSEESSGCYVIQNLDINGDGIADIRCAVDQGGLIFSLIFLSEPWIAVPDPADANADTGNAAALENTPPTGDKPAAGSEEVATEPSPYALDLESLERIPAGEELTIWRYVHMITISAAENGQSQLSEAAAVLDNGFYSRYGAVEATEDGESYSPTPTVFSTEEYALYIYDLPNETRFILYFDTTYTRCAGFNLQL